MILKKFLIEEQYNQIAQASWPSFDQLLAGKTAQDPVEQTKITEYVDNSYRTYVEQDVGVQIADQNRIMQSQVFFDKKTTIPNNCRVPWETLGVNSFGDVFICQSPAWVPKFAGNVHKANTIYDILNSETAIKIRQEIQANRYYYCNNNLCSFLQSQGANIKQLAPVAPEDVEPLPLAVDESVLVRDIPKNLIFDFDHTCNFRCPSCRTELINNNKHKIIRPINNKIVERIKTLIIDEIKDQPVLIRWAGGEPFISDTYFNLIEYITNKGKKNIKHIIQTNGSYLKSKGDVVEQLLPTIHELRISFDAATADSYHKIRVNGVWENLLDNVRWTMSKIREQNLNISVTGDFVVQQGNYKDIPLFAELCKELGITPNFQRMWDWYTWSKDEFNKHNVWTPGHPEYETINELVKQANELTKR